MVDRSSGFRVLAQESGLRFELALISGSRVFALDPEISGYYKNTSFIVL